MKKFLKKIILRVAWETKRVLGDGVSKRVPKEYLFEDTAMFLSRIFQEHNLQRYFFTYGTSLSLIRDGYLSVRQGDIDIAILEDDMNLLLELLQKTPRLLITNYHTENLDGSKGKTISMPSLKFPLYDPTKERPIVIKVYDALNLVPIDFYPLYAYSDSQYSKGYTIVNDVPWGEAGKTCYHSFAEYNDGLHDLSFPSILYPEYMRKSPEKFDVPMVQYRLMKSVTSWLDRVYALWDIRRMEESSQQYYSDLLKYAKKKNEVPGYYYQFQKKPVSVYVVEDNTGFSKRYRG